MQESRSTFLVTAALPMAGRSDGSAVSRSRSASSRTAGTAQISECGTPFTSAHHALAAILAAVISVNGACGTIRSRLA